MTSFPTNIVVSSDLTPASDSVFPIASTLAQAFDGKLFLIHIMHPKSLKKPEQLGDFPHLEKYFLQELDQPDLPKMEPSAPVAKVYRYSRLPARLIVSYAIETKADLICMATTEPNFRLRWWWAGRSTHLVARYAPCSVLCVPGRKIKMEEWQRPRYRRVTMLADLTDRTDKVVRRLRPIIEKFNSEVFVYPVTDDRCEPAGDLTGFQAILDKLDGGAQLLTFPDATARMANLIGHLKNSQVDLLAMTPEMRVRFTNPLVSDVLARATREAGCSVLIAR
jgi:nucleotide-binding universal stress UspA family protein